MRPWLVIWNSSSGGADLVGASSEEESFDFCPAGERRKSKLFSLSRVQIERERERERAKLALAELHLESQPNTLGAKEPAQSPPALEHVRQSPQWPPSARADQPQSWILPEERASSSQRRTMWAKACEPDSFTLACHVTTTTRQRQEQKERKRRTSRVRFHCLSAGAEPLGRRRARDAPQCAGRPAQALGRR